MVLLIGQVKRLKPTARAVKLCASAPVRTCPRFVCRAGCLSLRYPAVSFARDCANPCFTKGYACDKLNFCKKKVAEGEKGNHFGFRLSRRKRACGPLSF